MPTYVYTKNNSNDRFTLKLTLTETTDVNSNTSSVSYVLQLIANTSYHFAIYPIGRVITLNGVNVVNVSESASGNWDLAAYSTITLASGTTSIAHNADGTKTIGVAFSIDMDSLSYTPGPLSYSTTQTLTYIPRASKIASITSNVTVDGTNAVAVSITRNSTSFTHTVLITFGTKTYTATGIGTSLSYPIPTAWLSEIPSASSGTASVKVTTFNGSSQVGDPVYGSFKISVPDTNLPTMSAPTAAVVSANTTVNGWGVAVQGYSYANITHNSVVPSTGATISRKGVTYDGQMDETSPFSTKVFPSAGTAAISVYAVDSRGRSVYKTANVTVYAYANPKITDVICQRCTSAGVASNSGTYLKIKATASISTCNDKNSVSLFRVRYKLNGGSYGSWTSITSGTAKVLGAGAIDITKSYVVEIQITDALGNTNTTPYEYPIGTEIVPFHVKNGGSGVGIGKYAETDNLFDVGLPSRFRGAVSIDGSLPIDSGGTGAVTAAAARNNLGLGNTSGALPIANGGTGQTTVAAVRNALGLGNTSGALPIANGGTGATTLAAILTNLGIKDHIVDYGTSGSWMYFKFSSGICLAWGNQTYTGVSITNAWGTAFESTSQYRVAFPFTFTSITACLLTAESDSAGIMSLETQGTATTTASQAFYFIRPSSMSGILAYVFCLVCGRWK